MVIPDAVLALPAAPAPPASTFFSSHARPWDANNNKETINGKTWKVTSDRQQFWSFLRSEVRVDDGIWGCTQGNVSLPVKIRTSSVLSETPLSV
jgi:hypothetical protein